VGGVRDVRYAGLSGLLLDLGNTLVGMDAALVTAVLRREGVACSPEAFRRAEAAARPALSAWIANPVTDDTTTVVYVRTMLARLGIASAEAASLAPALVAHLRRIPTPRLWSEVLPGVPQALARLRARGLRLVVVSNSDGTAEAGMIETGLRGLVDGVVDSAHVGVEKPDRRIFEHALGLIDLDPTRVAHVGDLYAVDVVGAAGAGIPGVLLDPYGNWPDMGCATAPDVATLEARIEAARV